MTVDPSRVAAAELSAFNGEGWRHLSPLRDPLSGEGARLHGGRLNPPESFPVLYLCSTRPCTVAELRRLGDRQAIGASGLLPRYLYRYDVALERVLDLTNEGARSQVGLGFEVLTEPDWKECQELGVVAHALGTQAILSPSATGVDDILAVFIQNLGLGTLSPHLAQEWHSLNDLRGS